MGEVPPMLDITKTAVRGLQLLVCLCRLTCPTTEDGVFTLKPLHHVRHEGNLPVVCVQTRILLGDNLACGVLQVEQVPHIHGHA
jgi:hypothetical protein